MSDFSLKGYNGATGNSVDIMVRKLKDGVSPEEIKKATQKNDLDEVIVKDAKGDKYLIYADELTSADGDLAKVASANPNITFFEDEANEDVNGKFGPTGPGTIVEAALAAAQEIQIQKISDPVSDEVKNEVLKNLK